MIKDRPRREGSPNADLKRCSKGGETTQQWRKRKELFDSALIERGTGERSVITIRLRIDVKYEKKEATTLQNINRL